MADKIIMCIISLICAFMFFGIGVYSKKISKPMGFWSGTEVDGSKIIDIKKYNNANGNMWKFYSLFYFVSALLAIFYPLVSAILLIVNCSLGLVFLIVIYNKICKKYMIK